MPWAAALSRSGKLNQSRVLDMLRRRPSREPRLYLMEPYDPKREPLIMIHGLLSTPLAWAEMSNEPHEELKLAPEDRARLEDAFEWEPERSVHRILYVAVPHRGSAFADHFLGRLGTWITAPPATFQAFDERISKTRNRALPQQPPRRRAVGSRRACRP